MRVERFTLLAERITFSGIFDDTSRNKLFTLTAKTENSKKPMLVN